MVPNVVSLRNNEQPTDPLRESSIFSVAAPSLGGRMISSFSQSIMITGIIGSVIGLAIAFFTSNIVTGVGFGLCGIVSIIGIIVVENAQAAEALHNSTQELGEQEEFFQQQTKLIGEIERSLRKDTENLKSMKALFAANIKALANNHTKMSKAFVDLDAGIKALKESQIHTIKNKEELSRRLGDVKEFITSAKKSFEGYNNTHKEFMLIVSKFLGLVQGIGRIEENIKQTIDPFQADPSAGLPSTQEQVVFAQELSFHLQSSIDVMLAKQQDLLRGYSEKFDSINQSVMQIREFQSLLERTSAQLAPKEDHVSELISAMSMQKEALNKYLLNLDAKKKELEALRKDLKKTIENMEKVQSKMSENLKSIIAKADAHFKSKEEDFKKIHGIQVNKQKELEKCREDLDRIDIKQKQEKLQMERERGLLEDFRSQMLKDLDNFNEEKRKFAEQQELQRMSLYTSSREDFSI